MTHAVARIASAAAACAALTGAAGLGGCGSSALQTARAPKTISPAASTVIFDCAGKGQIRPATLTLFCADGGAVLSHVTWRDWGTTTAAGTGVDVVNTCTPDCAAGHTVSERVSLTATGLSLSGTSATYALLTVHGPAGTSGRFSLTINGPVAR